MPFTISHSFVAYPLKKFSKGKLSTSALAIGSMLPDMEYYAKMNLNGVYGHQLSYALFFGPLVCIILLFTYHNIVRDACIQHLPLFIKDRLSSFMGFDWNLYFRSNALWVLVSIWIGIITHFILDAFTHSSDFCPWIANTIIEKEYFGLYMYEWLFWIGSILGLIILAYYFFTLPVSPLNPYRSAKSKIKFWSIFTVLLVLFLALRISYGLGEEQVWIVLLVVFMSCSWSALFIVSLIYKLTSRSL